MRVCKIETNGKFSALRYINIGGIFMKIYKVGDNFVKKSLEDR